MFSDTISVTVNSEQRDHVKAWDRDFQAQIASGSTSIRKADITGGESLHRISHSSLKNDKLRHLEQMVESVVDSSDVARERKVHIVLEHDDTPDEKAATLLLAEGFVASLSSTNLSDLASNSL